MVMKAKKLLTRERVNEIIGVFFLLIGLFTLVSLLFFHPSDHSFYTTYPNQNYRNITGITGVYLAHYLQLIFGISSFSLSGLFLFWAGCFFLQKVPQKKWIEFVGIGISILSISSLFALIASESWKVKAGGVVGYFIAISLEKYFGVVGGLIISFCFLALSLVLATDFLLYPLFERLVEWFQNKIQDVNDLIPQKKPTFSPKKLAEPKKSAKSLVQKLLAARVKKYELESQNGSGSTKTKKIEAFETSFKDALNSAIKIKKIGDIAPAPPAPKAAKAPQAEPKTESKKAHTDESTPTHDISPFVNDKTSASYKLPSVDWLKRPSRSVVIEDDLKANSRILEETLRDFGVEVKVVEIEQGPVITRYEVLPAPGVKVTRIVSLSDDLALALKATSVRFITPIPGKSAIGIEIPNSSTVMVYLRELLEEQEFKTGSAKLPLVLGKDTSGKPMIADLTEMPHLLIAGATGSGKTVCVNSIVMGLLYSKTPSELRFVMVDPKMVEMAAYKGLPHMLTPVVTDVRKASVTLNWLVTEMERRYQIFAQCGTRNIQAFNTRKISPDADVIPDIPKTLPYIVLVIDELADLMSVAQDKVENAITRLAQLSRAVGIHLILATQRPSVDVITGVIKANFPARISFKVSSKVDSRTVLDVNGADKLLGKGDMLFMKPGDAKPTRGQSTWVSDEEINQTVEFIKKQQGPQYLAEIDTAHEGKSSVRQMEKDELYDEAVQVVLETRQASVSVLQRKLRLGYGRAARIIDMMEQEGIVGPFSGSKPREIYVDRVQEVSETTTSDS